MAAQKRVDNKRRILKDGESQLPDGRYRYRYFDMDGCRQVVYSWKLVERDRMPPGKKDDLSLREKERQIERDMEDSIKTGRDAKITLNQMFETYMTGKISLKQSTRTNYIYMYTHYVQDGFGKKMLKDIRYSDVKAFYNSLIVEKGFKANSMEIINTLIHPALTLAVRDGYIRFNPSDGVMMEIKKSHQWEKTHRHALTIEEQSAFLNYIASNEQYKHWVIAESKKATPVQVEDTPLSPEEQKMVNDFAEKIDITNSQMVLQYGAASQKKLSDFSETALSRVKTKDMGETGELITNLISELQGFDATTEQPKGIFGFFKKTSNSIEQLKTRYDSADKNVERIKAQLEDHQVTLMKDITMLDKMYELNLVYFKELTMYILAGKKKLAEVRANDLKAAQEKAQRTQLPEDAQAARDLADLCDRFEKKLYDLELTRNVSIQMGPQIRLIQSNDTMMAEKIQTTIVNTIPLWKNQMVLALGIAHSQQAMQAERAVTDATNELLKKNAATLKQGTIEIAKESERGIVDIETLQQTNKQLIETLDELNKIRADGKAKRANAEQELGRIEGELRQKMLEINN